eukprot:TRINITY_DN2287_c0_g1_i4.p2 TRINITY_DN2287_c0_g1~~TRINITY_DN2287_c0_g1_i4.p2  ORF type:complete len:234 (+),score=48.96 TRINITY_DN2287_c0_g1_i4:1119-1820(+)
MNVDGIVIPKDPFLAFLGGESIPVPILFGNCRNESSLFLCPLYPGGVSKEAYPLILNQFLREYVFGIKDYDKVVKLITNKFPVKVNGMDSLRTLVRVDNMIIWFYPIFKAMQVVSNLQAPDLYQYVLEIVPSWTNQCLGVAHSFDLPFIFPSLALAFNATFTPTEVELSEAMLGYWSHFVNFGRLDGPYWHRYGGSGLKNNAAYTVLDIPLRTGLGFMGEDVAWWEAVLKNNN